MRLFIHASNFLRVFSQGKVGKLSYLPRVIITCIKPIIQILNEEPKSYCYQRVSINLIVMSTTLLHQIMFKYFASNKETIA